MNAMHTNELSTKHHLIEHLVCNITSSHSHPTEYTEGNERKRSMFETHPFENRVFLPYRFGNHAKFSPMQPFYIS